MKWRAPASDLGRVKSPRWTAIEYSGRSAFRLRAVRAFPKKREAYFICYMANRILTRIPQSELELLEPHLERVTLTNRAILREPGSTISRLYFIVSGLVSVLTVMSDEASVQSAIIGDEGVAGVEVFLGAAQSSTREIVQVAGEALHLDGGQLRRLLMHTPVLASVLSGYVQLGLSMAYQVAACNRLHSVAQRYALWLLQMHDRAGRDDFDLTHESIAYMLGVRRPTVSEAARRLLNGGLVDYRRGRVRIIDRRGLERQACECDAILRQQRVLFLSS